MNDPVRCKVHGLVDGGCVICAAEFGARTSRYRAALENIRDNPRPEAGWRIAREALEEESREN